MRDHLRSSSTTGARWRRLVAEQLAHALRRHLTNLTEKDKAEMNVEMPRKLLTQPEAAPAEAILGKLAARSRVGGTCFNRPRRIRLSAASGLRKSRCRSAAGLSSHASTGSGRVMRRYSKAGGSRPDSALEDNEREVKRLRLTLFARLTSNLGINLPDKPLTIRRRQKFRVVDFLGFVRVTPVT